HPPTPPHFPYTTLFRSVPAEDEMTLLDEAQRVLATDPQKALALCERDAKANPRGSMAQEREVLAIDALMRLGKPAEAKSRAEKLDRKSTRLNSSHLGIS